MIMVMERIKKWFHITYRAFQAFNADQAMKLAASLSYYTLFSMGPMLVVIISFAGIFFGRQAAQGEIYEYIRDLIGSEAAKEVQTIIANVQSADGGIGGAIVGIALLLLGATGVFYEIQSSINYIWSVRAKPEKGWVKILINRLISFSLVISCGFILLVSLILSTLLEALSQKLQALFPNVSMVLFIVLNNVLIFVVTGVLFSIIFKVLPDASIRWKDIFIGAGFTAILFMIGKFLILFYLSNVDIGAIYGAAGSIIVIMLWIYYSSIILYFGAEFTQVNAIQNGAGIKLRRTAVFIVKQEAKEFEMSDEL